MINKVTTPKDDREKADEAAHEAAIIQVLAALLERDSWLERRTRDVPVSDRYL